MSYEVYIDIIHHKKHCDDYEEKLTTAFKLVDTGKPNEMVADALRRFANEIEGVHDGVGLA